MIFPTIHLGQNTFERTTRFVFPGGEEITVTIQRRLLSPVSERFKDALRDILLKLTGSLPDADAAFNHLTYRT